MTRTDNWSEKNLGYTFRDKRLLDQALTHRSASPQNNERFEFLGDALLDLVVSRILFDNKPDASEGSLSRFRASLVRGETLAEIGIELGLADILQMGAGERRSGGHRRGSVLANGLEALFGAVLLDGGFDSAERVVRHVYSVRLERLPDDLGSKDPKTRLQEWAQARQMEPPEYELLEVSGAAHAQSFAVRCRVENLDADATGAGQSRRRAEQAAAAALLDKLPDAD